MVNLRWVTAIRAGSVSAASEGSSHAHRFLLGGPSRMITASRYTSMKDRMSASRLFQVLGGTTQISTRDRAKASRSCAGALVDSRLVDSRQASGATERATRRANARDRPRDAPIPGRPEARIGSGRLV